MFLPDSPCACIALPSSCVDMGIVILSFLSGGVSWKGPGWHERTSFAVPGLFLASTRLDPA